MKKGNVLEQGLLLFMTCVLAGCTSYTPTLVRLNPSGPNITKATHGDLTLYIDEYATPEKSAKAFDTDMADEGVLPLLILVENNGEDPCEVKPADIIVRGDTVLKGLIAEEAVEKASRGAVGRAIGWSLIVPIIAIPIAATASAVHTSGVNKQIVQDFSAKVFQDSVILPHKDHSGFLFFELDEGRKDLAGLTLEMTAKNVTTGEVVTFAAPLPAATFAEKEEASAQERQLGENPMEP